MTFTMVDDALARVEQRLNEVAITNIPVLQETSSHILSSQGKMIRPRLVFLSHLAAGGQDLGEAIPLAAAVELVHSATLVHDDINDHSLTRRGKVSVHAHWGRTFALLTGDYLFTKVYELMAPYGARLNTIMADACVRLVEGETLQASAAKDGQIDRQTYFQIISLKTASLFEASARMGAMLADGDNHSIENLALYGFNLGLAFQIVDDVLDIIGSEEVMGKPVGSDLVQGSGAVLAQNGQRVRAKLAATDGNADPIRAMITRLRDSGAVDSALSQAHELAGKARLALGALSSSPAREELETLIDLVLDRER